MLLTKFATIKKLWIEVFVNHVIRKTLMQNYLAENPTNSKA